MSSKNNGNFGRAALRHHIGLLCTTILRDPKPMPPFRLPRRVSNLLTHHGLTASPASRPHSAAPPRARAKLSAPPPPPPPSSWQAGTSGLPRISGELLHQEPWVVIDCCRGSGSSMNVWKDSLNYQRLRIHISVSWANNSLNKNVMLIYIYIYIYIYIRYIYILYIYIYIYIYIYTIKESNIHSNIFGADKRLENILIKLIKLIKSNLFMA